MYISRHWLQSVVFKPLSYCFEETIGLDVKASFERPPKSRLIKQGDIRISIKGYLIPLEFSLITNCKNYKLTWNFLLILILYKLSSSVKRQNERCFKYNQTSFWQLLLSTLQISLQISPMKINLCWTRKFNNAGEGWQEKYIQCLYFFRKDFLWPNGNLHFKVCFWPLKYLSEQGGLNKNEIQLNLCKIFSILIFNEPYLFP